MPFRSGKPALLDLGVVKHGPAPGRGRAEKLGAQGIQFVLRLVVGSFLFWTVCSTTSEQADADNCFAVLKRIF